MAPWGREHRGVELPGDVMDRAVKRRFACMSIAACSIGMPAAAINDMFAKDAPITRMTEDDFKVAGDVMRNALDRGQDGQTFRWENASTSASGTITVVDTFEKKGMTCRGTAFTITTRGETSRSTWNVCRTPEGWKVSEGR